MFLPSCKISFSGIDILADLCRAKNEETFFIPASEAYTIQKHEGRTWDRFCHSIRQVRPYIFL